MSQDECGEETGSLLRSRFMESEEARWLSLQRLPGERLADAAERTVREAIRGGSLRPGVRLPSSRTLALQLGVSRGVITEAYEQLAAQGYLVSRPKAAPVVADAPRPMPRPAPRCERPGRVRFDFTATTPDVSQFPVRQWAASLATAARSMPVSAYDYGDPRGSEKFREVLAGHLGRTRGVVADPEQILGVHGTAQGIDLLLRTLRAAGAQRVGVEDPSLPSQIDRITAHGLAARPIPIDGDGLLVDGLEVDAVLVTPAHQFPTGVVLSGERRRALLDWAKGASGLVLEDDYDAEFRYDRQPVRALQGLDPEHVAYLGTTSKTLAPALRLGWMVLPAHHMPQAQRIRNLMDVCPPAVEQQALAMMIERGDYDRHVRRARKAYRRRREQLIAALAERLPGLRVEGIAAGMHLLLRLPADLDDAAIAARALDKGVQVAPLSQFSHSGHPGSGLVLGYGRITERDMNPAVAALATAIRT
ncbi:PLP-dependent aminotransferase family protein [Spongiactinospora sp. 9N601]|uniref:MocR-like pyridoxine biosynthesis transcription factor PdxR n=1 Tax=Spongiactinospora sp. 9N601 TaxID=3375149 RepID=UPI0037C511B3